MWFCQDEEHPRPPNSEADDSLSEYDSDEDSDDDDFFAACIPCSDEFSGEDDFLEDNYKHNDSVKELDYDRDIITPLYHYIQTKKWSKAAARAREDPRQARVWVYRHVNDDNTGSGGASAQKSPQQKQIKWRLLPLHAAIIFRAPGSVIRAIIDAFPGACALGDDQGHLPLHLAFKTGLFKDDEALCLLMESNPESSTTRDGRGMLPQDYLKGGRRRWITCLAAGHETVMGRTQGRNSGDDKCSPKEIRLECDTATHSGGKKRTCIEESQTNGFESVLKDDASGSKMEDEASTKAASSSSKNNPGRKAKDRSRRSGGNKHGTMIDERQTNGFDSSLKDDASSSKMKDEDSTKAASSSSKKNPGRKADDCSRRSGGKKKQRKHLEEHQMNRFENVLEEGANSKMENEDSSTKDASSSKKKPGRKNRRHRDSSKDGKAKVRADADDGRSRPNLEAADPPLLSAGRPDAQLQPQNMVPPPPARTQNAKSVQGTPTREKKVTSNEGVTRPVDGESVKPHDDITTASTVASSLMEEHSHEREDCGTNEWKDASKGTWARVDVRDHALPAVEGKPGENDLLPQTIVAVTVEPSTDSCYPEKSASSTTANKKWTAKFGGWKKFAGWSTNGRAKTRKCDVALQ